MPNIKDKQNEKKAAQEKARLEKKAREDAKREKARAEKEKAEKAKAEKAKAEKAKAEKAKAEKAKAEKAKAEKAKAAKEKSGSGERRGLRFLGGLLFAKMAKGGAAELRSHAEEVNNLNVFPVPDGDTGDNMRMTIESGVAAIENVDSDDLAEVMKMLSHGMLLGARGNSGVILSQFFAGVASGFESSQEADPKTLGRALELGVSQAYSTVMTPTEGTILTVAREAVEYAVARLKPQSTIRTFFADLVGEMHASVERTPDRLPALKEAGVVDSGGAGLFYILDGFNRVLNGEEISYESSTESDSNCPKTEIAFGPDSEMVYGYCTELLVQLMNAKCVPDEFDIEPLRAFLSEIGDSIVAFKTGSIVKLHVHTKTPEKVLEYCRAFGEFITVKIENMSVQHTENSATEESEAATEASAVESAFAPVEQAPKSAETIKKTYGAVCVASGDGFESIFRELGADEVIRGGQTNNPAAKDFIEAFEKINAEHIFVFPNNSNILLAATQAAGIYERAKIHVIPSKSMGTGYAALASLNFDSASADDIATEAEQAMEKVCCGYISPAIRDAEMNGIQIKNGDTIGIVGKDIVVSCEDSSNAALALADYLLEGEERFMLTVFKGINATTEECEALEESIKEKHPEIEIYVLDGGQEIYPLVFLAE